jgi:hypothetical protein
MVREDRVVLEPWPDGLGDSVKFRLVLRGHLPPDKRGTVDVKQRIRRELHPQLKTLWQQHPTLKSAWRGNDLDPVPKIDEIAADFSKCGYRFVPLVRVNRNMACSLDFLILRRKEQHRVFSGAGDLDGRVKTLIDGLRMPGPCNELGGATPSSDEDPFFCLLEDDALIYDFKVVTDTLLVPPEPDEPERDIVAIIDVHVRAPDGGEVTRPYQGRGFL